MTQEINALYNKGMRKLIKSDYNLRWIATEAMELAKKEGEATVIRVREGLPDLGFVSINILKYDKTGKSTAETTVLPRTTIDLIAETYKK